MLPFRSCWSQVSYGLVTLALAGVTGCGNSGEVVDSASDSSAPNRTSATPTRSASPPATSSAAPSPTADIRVIEVQIADGTVQAEADRVEVAPGEAVRVVVTSDVADELHVHGVDETAMLVADEPTTLEFTIDEPGVFDVETHHGGLVLFQLLVR